MNTVKAIKNYLKSGASVDSRLVFPGHVFFALKGSKTDGHKYLPQVKEKGGEAAVVAKDYDGHDFGLKLFFVDDVLRTLQALAQLVLRQRKTKIIAVTGSLGKTTTKDFIYQIVKDSFKTVKSPGNYNSQIGLPLTILNDTSDEDELLVLEMAMTEKGQIKKLVEIAPPDIALLTKVALVHAGNFDSIEDIARAKAEIFSHPNTKKALLNRDCEQYAIVEKMVACEKITYSQNDPETEWLQQPLPFLPSHLRSNLFGAVKAALALGMEKGEINEALKKIKCSERRFEEIKKNGIHFVNDTYNAAACSVKAALAHLPKPQNCGRRIAVIGTMPELGKFSYQCHLEVGEFSLNYLDKIYCLGLECEPIFKVWENAGRKAFLTDRRDELISLLKKDLKPGDVVLLKGGNYLRLWEILDEF